MKNQEKKPKLIFIPHYVGALRYHEKLIPHLSDKYEICFLLLDVKRDRQFFEEMRNYCSLRGYCFKSIEILGDLGGEDSRDKKSFWIIQKIKETWSQFRTIMAFKNSANKFLKDSYVKKIISVNDNSLYMRYLLDAANRKGIDTMVLQWALTYEGQRLRVKKDKSFLRKKIYYFVKRIFIFFNRFMRKVLLGGDFEHKKGVAGDGPAKRVGVINNQAKEYLMGAGVPEGKLSVVGYMDFYLAEKTKKELDSNLGAKIKIAQKYGIDLSKKNITIFSCPKYLKDVTTLTKEGQLDYTERTVVSLRKVCTENLFQINIKAHPSEEISLYESLTKKYGVKLFDKSADNFELIYLSDLYISENSTTNFIPIIMRKDIIFQNLLNLPVVETVKDYFGIKRFVHTDLELENAVKNWSEGKLEKQYIYEEKIFTPNSLQKIIKWIG